MTLNQGETARTPQDNPTYTAGDRVVLARFEGRPKGTVLSRIPPRHYYVVVKRDNEQRPIVCIPEELEMERDGG